MAYIVGISSGWWRIARAPELQGLAIKAASFGATAGVTFNQLDLESLAEFIEPRMKQNIKRVQKELGLKLGLHAEIGQLAEMESAEKYRWDQSHERLVQTIKNAEEIGMVYVNFHLSSAGLIQSQEAQLRLQGYLSQSVAPDGRPFWTLAEKSPVVKDYILKYEMILRESHVPDLIHREPEYKKMAEEVNKKYLDILEKSKELIRRQIANDPVMQNQPEEIKRQEIARREALEQERLNEQYFREINESKFLYEAWKKSSFAQYVLHQGEIDAYMIVAEYMKTTGDTFWMQIAKNQDPDKAYIENPHAFNAAVACKYIEGHLMAKDNKWNKEILEGKSVLEWLNDKNVTLTFEIPEVEGALEAQYRLYDPRHAYWLAKKINHPKIKLCIDFEHMLAQRLDPYKVLPELPDDAGKYIFLFHLGEPKPYLGQAHIPIPLNSQAQEIIYEWLYMMRKKGFKDGILIFERGGGVGGTQNIHVFGQSVTALRQIAKYLDQDVKPGELPFEFYGISEQNAPEFAKQRVNIREHAFDPLEGVLSVPEEKHTFLSAAAVAKQKGQEWERRKLR